MANYGVQKSSLTAVLSWYNNQDETAFRIFRGNKENDAFFCDAYTGTDKEEGEMSLVKSLNEIEPTDYNVYFLKLYPVAVKAKKTGPGITFQLHSQQAVGAVYQNPGQYQAMNEILSEIRALREERIADPEEEEEEAPATPGGILAGILQTPAVQNMLVNMLSGIMSNIMAPKPAPIQAVAGIETDDLSEIIKTLLSKGVTVNDLAKLAAMDQGQINFLLSMLRK